MSFAYVSVREQNHVVQDKKTEWFVWYFLLVFEKVLVYFILRKSLNMPNGLKFLFKKIKWEKSLDKNQGFLGK